MKIPTIPTEDRYVLVHIVSLQAHMDEGPVEIVAEVVDPDHTSLPYARLRPYSHYTIEQDYLRKGKIRIDVDKMTDDMYNRLQSERVLVKVQDVEWYDV